MGYGYQERDIDKTIIDWSGLTKTISDNLINESNRREELKFKNDQNQAKELEKLSEFEQGLDPNANKWAMKQAQQAREFKMLNHKMMKGGFRSVNDAKLISQNVMDGWSELNAGLKTYNQNYERIGKLGGKGNQFLQEQMASFADIENKSIWNDPKTGTAYFVNIDPETGDVDKSSLKPVRSLNNIQAQSFETINVEETTAKLATNTKPWELATSSTSSIKDARLNPVYKQWKENSLASLLSSDQKIASVLMDYLDLDPTDDMNDDSTKSYTYERVKGYDKNGEPIMESVTANIGKIKMKYENGKLVPNLTDKQRKLAKDAVEASLEAKLARTTKKQFVASPRKSGSGKTEQDAKSLYNLSTRVALGESTAFDQIEGRLYTVTDDKGTRKSVKLGRPILTEEGNIVITDVNGIEIKTFPKGPESALAIANIIRSGSAADQVQSLFEQGEKLSGGKIPGLRSDIDEGKPVVSALDEMPENEDDAEKWLKNNLPSDIEVSIPFAIGQDKITLKKGNDSKDFDTKNLEGIKAWLDKYNANPVKIGKSKESGEGKKVDAFGNEIQ